MKNTAIAATLATLAALAAFAAAPAHAGAFTAEANAAHADDKDGLELGLGYRVAAGNFRLTPIVGAFISRGENDGRYRTETFTNGQTICRDTSNGQFADKENCGANFDTAAYGKIEASYRFGGKVGRRDFYRQLCLALGLAPSATAAAVFWAVSTHVQELARDRVHPVFLLDEAHLLHQDTLDHLHILLNYEWDSKPLLSLVLVGLGDFDERLRLHRNRSLYSRIARRLTIDPLTPEDAADYIRVRLRRVGCEKDIFTPDAVSMLHEATASSLRDTDRIATAALRLAVRKKRKLVDRDVLTAVLKREPVA